MQRVNIHEAKTHLSKLVEIAAAGEEIIIAKSGKPVARLVAISKEPTPRKKGLLEGRIEIKPEFDQPLPDEAIGLFEGRGQP
jgi:prevent-host-death family protein